eukprot:scaffold189563_cov31-Tisochrysis_lutea.AAC.1
MADSASEAEEKACAPAWGEKERTSVGTVPARVKEISANVPSAARRAAADGRLLASNTIGDAASEGHTVDNETASSLLEPRRRRSGRTGPASRETESASAQGLDTVIGGGGRKRGLCTSAVGASASPCRSSCLSSCLPSVGANEAVSSTLDVEPARS